MRKAGAGGPPLPAPPAAGVYSRGPGWLGGRPRSPLLRLLPSFRVSRDPGPTSGPPPPDPEPPGAAGEDGARLPLPLGPSPARRRQGGGARERRGGQQAPFALRPVVSAGPAARSASPCPHAARRRTGACSPSDSRGRLPERPPGCAPVGKGQVSEGRRAEAPRVLPKGLSCFRSYEVRVLVEQPSATFRAGLRPRTALSGGHRLSPSWTRRPGAPARRPCTVIWGPFARIAAQPSAPVAAFPQNRVRVPL